MSLFLRCMNGAYLTVLSLVTAGLCVLMFAFPVAHAHHGNAFDPAAGSPTTAGLHPQLIPGNISGTGAEACAYIGSSGPESFKRDGEFPEGTVFNLPGGGVVTVNAGKTFSWSGVVMHDILVKGGPDTNWYDYDGEGFFPLSSDSNLHSPVKGNGFYGLSHIVFCYTPGDPDITVTKTCPAAPVLINGGLGGATYNYNVRVENTGDGKLSNLQVQESLSNCNIESTTGIVLDEGQYVDLAVSCTSASPLPENGRNMAKVTADTEFGHEPMVMDTGDTNDADPPNCPENAPPPIDIVKECSNPMVRLVEVNSEHGPILGVQACVDITVTNLGDADDETLVNVTLFDSIALSSPKSLPDLAPGAHWSGTICYFPEMPTGPTLDESDGDFTGYSVFTVLEDILSNPEALFSNKATVRAVGAFSGQGVQDMDDAHCSICYSDDPGLPSACPPPSKNPYPLFQ